ncbi:saccharopine dehydrogenase [Bacterioplanes sanyensis]|uniref:Saccharopine dehydrogenase n=1 Tax=Bacterioplanes sanyensis TaxID=1249553 RepID=A0A222FJ38_9GAMM|nr:saccharopine dehydrogenase NADP-binding domain-containing protein [Bacterioplanes sanyensis]ASP38662.1 saccharopine dehydrogenase [Bacterioplanes sanyensis]
MSVTRVVILGGYGNFGKRIAETLADVGGITIIIAGRSLNKANTACQQLSGIGSQAELQAARLDIQSSDFNDALAALAPDLVIHTSGPFQGQGYQVAQACIAAGSHYIDLADDRRFVCDISALQEQAVANDVLLVSGASSVPGLSSTVIDGFSDRFESLHSIDFAIAPGNQAERGEATVAAILSYTGHAFPVYINGRWQDRFGWMSPRRVDFGRRIGKRWLANIDIPDLELFAQRYPTVKNVTFQAGLELSFLHFGMVFMALLARVGLVKDWSKFTRPIFKCSELFERFGTDTGGMQITLTGTDKHSRTKTITWTLCAEQGVGPYIPTISAIILAKKLIAGQLTKRGASACLDMYTLAEFDAEVSHLAIHHTTEEHIG